MIVVDANIIAYLWIPGNEVYKCKELLIKDQDWWAPILYKSEMRSVFSLYARKGIMEIHAAIQLMKKIEDQFMHTCLEVPSNLVLRLSHQTQCSSYDCEYAGLAMLLKCPLITIDKKILKAFPAFTFTPHAFIEEL